MCSSLFHRYMKPGQGSRVLPAEPGRCQLFPCSTKKPHLPILLWKGYRKWMREEFAFPVLLLRRRSETASKLEALFLSQIRLFQMQSLQIPITLKITVGAMMSFLISVFSVSLNLQRVLVLTVVFSLQFRLSRLLPMPRRGKIPGKRWRILMFSCCVGFRCCSYWQHLHHMPSVFASLE